MKRTKEAFVSILNEQIPLAGTRILEIGCGSGNYTRQLAAFCHEIVAVDPDAASLSVAQQQSSNSNVTYLVKSADNLANITGDFDIAIFTLSLHHVTPSGMAQAIDGAIRLLRPTGFLVFLEPALEGSFFEAELSFGACDGDEREAKTLAQEAMQHHPRLASVAELEDQTEFVWDSFQDFIDTMHPHNNLRAAEHFLVAHNFTLVANRRINIFRIAKDGVAG